MYVPVQQQYSNFSKSIYNWQLNYHDILHVPHLFFMNTLTSSCKPVEYFNVWCVCPEFIYFCLLFYSLMLYSHASYAFEVMPIIPKINMSKPIYTGMSVEVTGIRCPSIATTNIMKNIYSYYSL